MHAVLQRCGISRLSQVDRAAGEPVRRYEHEQPGDLLHHDVEEMGKVPDDGGWRYVGKQQGDRNRARTRHRGRNSYTGDRTYGHNYVHTVVGKATPISRLTNLPGPYS